MDTVNASIIYYSATGTMSAMASTAAEEAEHAGAQTRLRQVAELARPEAVEANPAWRQHRQDTQAVPEAALDDLAWADVVIFGTPTRFGAPASQLKAFIDTTGPLWQQDQLADKVYTAMTCAGTLHGGHEATILALEHVFHHWGGIIVPPGYTDPIQYQSGNPYGTSAVAAEGSPDETTLAAVRHQARRAISTAIALKTGRVALHAQQSRYTAVN